MTPEGWKVFKSLITKYHATISIFLKCLRLYFKKNHKVLWLQCRFIQRREKKPFVKYGNHLELNKCQKKL